MKVTRAERPFWYLRNLEWFIRTNCSPSKSHLCRKASFWLSCDWPWFTGLTLIFTVKWNNILHHSSDMFFLIVWRNVHIGLFQSGLTEAVRKSTISLSEAENRMLKFVQEYTVKGKAPLAGNSIHADRMFLEKYMPSFLEHLHYRIVDVSTIKELSR